MREQFDRIEQRLQYLIETGIPSLLPPGIANRTLVREVIAAMQANLFTAADGSVYAPNLFTLQVNPERVPDWQADPSILPGVARDLSQAASESGFRFFHPPIFRVIPEPSVSGNGIKITAAIGQEGISDTAAVPSQPGEADHMVAVQANAFLIINGQVIPLVQPVINIGRRLDNQLVIDDPRVSRTHAQLRAMRGQYVLFDLNSTGGTYVNGQRVSRYLLNPGDVISLSGVALIFGQDDASSPEQPQSGEEHLPSGTTQSIPRKPANKSPGSTHHP